MKFIEEEKRTVANSNGGLIETILFQAMCTIECAI